MYCVVVHARSKLWLVAGVSEEGGSARGLDRDREARASFHFVHGFPAATFFSWSFVN